MGNPFRLLFAWRLALRLDAEIARARAAAVEAEIEEVSRELGIAGRVEAVRAAMPSADFQAAFRAAGSPETNDEEGIRGLVLEALARIGVDTTDVLVTVFWTPPHVRFTVRGMTPAARQRCIDAIAARATPEAS